MTFDDNTILMLVIGLAAVALIVVATVAWRRRARAHTVALRERFGPEYDHALNEHGSPARAERELARRARRVEKIEFRDLTEADRGRFEAGWQRIQAQFVDDPRAAVAGANQLIKEAMGARGYPSDGFEQRAADLSVDHPDVVQHYRAARALAESSDHQGLNTEDLRQAVVHYRVLFADLLQPATTAAPARPRSAPRPARVATV